MRPQTILVVVLALAFAGVAAVGVLVYAGKDPGDRSSMTTVVVAAADVARGDTLKAESVTTKEYPRDFAPEGAVSKLEDAVGRSSLAALVKGEAVLEQRLAAKGTRGPAALIKPGMRLITIPTPSVTSNLPGFIEVGSRVDILWTPQEVSRDDRSARPDGPLLENIEVFAVDGKIDAAAATGKPDTSPIKSVTLQVGLEDSARLAPALTRGTIHLSLRNPEDDGRAPARPMPAPKATPPPPSAGPPAPPPMLTRTLRTIRGTRAGAVRLDAAGPGNGREMSGFPVALPTAEDGARGLLQSSAGSSPPDPRSRS